MEYESAYGEEHIPMIKGYGTNLVMNKEPGVWRDQYGDVVDEEMVRDIDETLKMPEPQIAAKIASQTGKRYNPLPTEDALASWREENNFWESVKEKVESAAHEKAHDYARNQAGATIVDYIMETPRYKKPYQQVYDSVLNNGKQYFTSYYRNAKQAEAAAVREAERAAKKAAEPPKAPSENDAAYLALADRLKRKPTNDEWLAELGRRKDKPPKEKDEKIIDLKRLTDMIANAREGGKVTPTEQDVLVIDKAARSLGFKYEPFERTVKNWRGKETKEMDYRLVPLQTIAPPSGFTDSGRKSGGKRVFVKGNQAWIEP